VYFLSNFGLAFSAIIKAKPFLVKNTFEKNYFLTSKDAVIVEFKVHMNDLNFCNPSGLCLNLRRTNFASRKPEDFH
jgi:hypothetical protein